MNVQLTVRDKTVRDFFQFHVYFTNYIGLTFHIMGYGIKLNAKIFDPKDKL